MALASLAPIARAERLRGSRTIRQVATFAANQRLTFRVHGRAGFLADQLAGLGAFAIALAITTGAIALLAIVAPRAALPVEIAVVVVANVIATIVRFLVLRSWMDRARDHTDRPRIAPEAAPR